MWQQQLEGIKNGEARALARAISLVENEGSGYEALLQALPRSGAQVIGITGPPGAGKSTLVNALIGAIVANGHRVAVLCVDPSSPFNLGAVLGDRIRMNDWYLHPNVFIRSLATRGSMGGLHPKIIEITELVKSAGYDFVIVETVGVGQSEIEIAGLADATVVVLVPEAGDEVQTMKAGLMEIADIFVVNKADRPDADAFVRNLRLMLAPAFQKHREVPIVKTVGPTGEGVDKLLQHLQAHLQDESNLENRYWLLTEKLYHLVARHRMQDIDKEELKETVKKELGKDSFNIYRLSRQFIPHK